MKLTTIRENGQETFNDGDIDLVNDLFRELKSCFPAWGIAIKSIPQQDETKRQWVKSFVENHINSIELIEKGMIQARKQPTDFFPSPGKFVEWCRPKEHFEHRRMKAEDDKFKDRQRLRLEAKPPRAEVGRAALDKMRDLLTKGDE